MGRKGPNSRNAVLEATPPSKAASRNTRSQGKPSTATTTTTTPTTTTPPKPSPSPAFSQAHPSAGGGSSSGPPTSGAASMVVRWPDNGKVSRSWLRHLTACLDHASRHLPPQQLPSVMPPETADALLLAAYRLLHREPNVMRVTPRQKDRGRGEGQRQQQHQQGQDGAGPSNANHHVTSSSSNCGLSSRGSDNNDNSAHEQAVAMEAAAAGSAPELAARSRPCEGGPKELQGSEGPREEKSHSDELERNGIAPGPVRAVAPVAKQSPQTNCLGDGGGGGPMLKEGRGGDRSARGVAVVVSDPESEGKGAVCAEIGRGVDTGPETRASGRDKLGGGADMSEPAACEREGEEEVEEDEEEEEKEDEVMVIGDVHGQFHDVVRLISLMGEVGPTHSRVWVFNGDYVDRGAWGVETYLLLLAWKLYQPERVVLLRGNHETKYCISHYGFERELMTKYGAHAQHLLRRCLACFESHPLAAVVAGATLVCHGGLFRDPECCAAGGGGGGKRGKGKGNGKEKAGRKGERGGKKGQQQQQKGRGGARGGGDGGRGLQLGCVADLEGIRRGILDPSNAPSQCVLSDVLWSDPAAPQARDLLVANDKRGIGLLFGPDRTQEFLIRNHLKLVIRSHEGPDAREKRPEMQRMGTGFAVDHDVPAGKLVTLFSAPDYPQFQAGSLRHNNRAAFVRLNAPAWDTPRVEYFGPVLPRPKAIAYYDFIGGLDSDDNLSLGGSTDDDDDDDGGDSE